MISSPIFPAAMSALIPLMAAKSCLVRGRAAQSCQKKGAVGAMSHFLPDIGGVNLIQRNIRQFIKFILNPALFAFFFKAPFKPLIQIDHMSYIGQRVFDLLVGQRASAPIG